MLVHQFFGRGDFSDRAAFVFREKGEYVVMFVKDSAIISEVNLTGRSEQFAEDTAENWVLGGEAT